MAATHELARQDDKPKPIQIETANRGLELRTIEDMFRFAQFVCKSGFAPKGIDTPEAALVAIQMGFEIGLSPMQAIQNIAVINGRPSVWGDAVKAIVLATGACEDFQEWFENDGDNDKLTAHCRIERRGFSPVERYFSIDDAKRAELYSKPGPWKHYTRRMLQLRARSWACRDAFPDALKGLYMAEEANDMPAERIDVTPPKREIAEIDIEAIKAAEPPENSKAEASDSPQPVTDTPETLVAAIAEAISNVPSDEIANEIIAEIRKEMKMRNNSWRTWETGALKRLHDALTKQN